MDTVVIISLAATGADMTALLAAHAHALETFLGDAQDTTVELTYNGEVSRLPDVPTGTPDEPGPSEPGGYGSTRQYTIRVAVPEQNQEG